MMMKKSVIAAALLSGVMFGGAVGAYAASNLEEIRAYLNRGISFEIKGNAWIPTDSSGTPAPPITYDGTTYLPLRVIANALDVPVDYDASTNKVLLGQMLDGVGHDSPLVPVTYSEVQLKAINHTFSYPPVLPERIVQGDVFQEASCTEDTCTLRYKHLGIGESQRDYSDPEQIEKEVTLSNGVKASWLKQGSLYFKVGDVYVNLGTRDYSLSDAQIEKIGATMVQSPVEKGTNSAAASLD